MDFKNTNTNLNYIPQFVNHFGKKVCVFVFVVFFQTVFAQGYIETNTKVTIKGEASIYNIDIPENNCSNDSVTVYISENTIITNKEQIYWKWKNIEKSPESEVIVKIKPKKKSERNDFEKKTKKESIVTETKRPILKPYTDNEAFYFTNIHNGSIVPVNNYQLKLHTLAANNPNLSLLFVTEKSIKLLYKYKQIHNTSVLNQYFTRPPPF